MDKFFFGVIIGLVMSFLVNVVVSQLERSAKNNVVTSCIKSGQIEYYGSTYECKKVGN